MQHFQGVHTIPTSKQTVKLFIEKLCEIELRANEMATSEATAFVAHENNKKLSNYTKANSSKSKKRELIAKNIHFRATW
jgi:hypothetical protein